MDLTVRYLHGVVLHREPSSQRKAESEKKKLTNVSFKSLTHESHIRVHKLYNFLLHRRMSMLNKIPQKRF